MPCSILAVMPTTDSPPNLDAFFARWRVSNAAGCANYVHFPSELCTPLDRVRPTLLCPIPVSPHYNAPDAAKGLRKSV